MAPRPGVVSRKRRSQLFTPNPHEYRGSFPVLVGVVCGIPLGVLLAFAGVVSMLDERDLLPGDIGALITLAGIVVIVFAGLAFVSAHLRQPLQRKLLQAVAKNDTAEAAQLSARRAIAAGVQDDQRLPRKVLRQASALLPLLSAAGVTSADLGKRWSLQLDTLPSGGMTVSVLFRGGAVAVAELDGETGRGLRSGPSSPVLTDPLIYWSFGVLLSGALIGVLPWAAADAMSNPLTLAVFAAIAVMLLATILAVVVLNRSAARDREAFAKSVPLAEEVLAEVSPDVPASVIARGSEIAPGLLSLRGVRALEADLGDGYSLSMKVDGAEDATLSIEPPAEV